ncbi:MULTISPECIES: winged helix-turn-helix domain-containing protein [Sphingobacterium]|uniref:winged helix-turn-helix domain-containing protein n=1 Tax=Sphingobacterium TaxID=28453 RepID=UPI0013DB9775|nr:MULTISPECIES: winged helix-turn-helix transcriptional regulator [unclassified Sphingobacterium]
MGETLRRTSATILSLIKDNPYITRQELAEKANLSVRGVEYQIDKLKKQKLINRIGSTKSGFWAILE